MSSKANWYKYYGDTPITINYPDISMYKMIKKTADEYPLNTAYDFMGKSVIYSDFIKEVDLCAKALIAMGVKKGDTVTVCLPNLPHAVVMFYAINKIGAIASMIHPLSAENEIMFYLNEADSKFAITLTRFFDKFEAIKGKTKLKTVIACKIEEGLSAFKGFVYKFMSVRVLAFICHKKITGLHSSAVYNGAAQSFGRIIIVTQFAATYLGSHFNCHSFHCFYLNAEFFSV